MPAINQLLPNPLICFDIHMISARRTTQMGKCHVKTGEMTLKGFKKATPYSDHVVGFKLCMSSSANWSGKQVFFKFSPPLS